MAMVESFEPSTKKQMCVESQGVCERRCLDHRVVSSLPAAVTEFLEQRLIFTNDYKSGEKYDEIAEGFLDTCN